MLRQCMQHTLLKHNINSYQTWGYHDHLGGSACMHHTLAFVGLALESTNMSTVSPRVIDSMHPIDSPNVIVFLEPGCIRGFYLEPV